MAFSLTFAKLEQLAPPNPRQNCAHVTRILRTGSCCLYLFDLTIVSSFSVTMMITFVYSVYTSKYPLSSLVTQTVKTKMLSDEEIRLLIVFTVLFLAKLSRYFICAWGKISSSLRPEKWSQRDVSVSIIDEREARFFVVLCESKPFILECQKRNFSGRKLCTT